MLNRRVIRLDFVSAFQMPNGLRDDILFLINHSQPGMSDVIIGIRAQNPLE